MIQNRYDKIDIKAVLTPEGWIKDRPVLTRSGIFEYRDNTGKVIKEYRSDDEVFHADSLGSLSGIPVTNGHVGGMISSDNATGILGTVIGPGVKEDSNVVADIIIHDTKKLGARRELSLGYKSDIVATPGTTPNGERYDAIQKNIRYNHLAVVTKGRAGNARLRLDSNEASSFDVENDDMTDTRMTMVRLDNGLEYAAAQEVAQAFASLVKEIGDRTKNYDTLQAQKDSLAGQVAEAQMILEQVATVVMDESKQPKELPAKVKAVIESIEERIKDRMGLEIVAAKHEIKFDEKMTNLDLKKAVVTKLKGESFRFDGKSDEYVNSAYDLVVETSDAKASKIGEQRKAVTPNNNGNKSPLMGAAAARAKMVTTIRAGRSF